MSPLPGPARFYAAHLLLVIRCLNSKFEPLDSPLENVKLFLELADLERAQ